MSRWSIRALLGRRGLARLLATLSACAVVWPASSCLMSSDGISGTLGLDSRVLLVVSRWPAGPDVDRVLLAYSPDGSLLSRRQIDSKQQFLTLDSSGTLWMASACNDAVRCNAVVSFDREGRELGRIRFHDSFHPFLRGGRLFLSGVLFSTGLLDLREIDLETGQLAPLPLIRVVDADSASSARPSWTIGNDGSQAVTYNEDGRFHVARFDPEGNRASTSSFPLASENRAAEGSSGQLFGGITDLSLDDSGRLLLAQHAYGSDCEDYQPPSVVVLIP